MFVVVQNFLDWHWIELERRWIAQSVWMSFCSAILVSYDTRSKESQYSIMSFVHPRAQQSSYGFGNRTMLSSVALLFQISRRSQFLNREFGCRGRNTDKGVTWATTCSVNIEYNLYDVHLFAQIKKPGKRSPVKKNGGEWIVRFPAWATTNRVLLVSTTKQCDVLPFPTKAHVKTNNIHYR